jgi:hypothetical protein
MEDSRKRRFEPPSKGLHVCPKCNSKLVIPLDWRQTAEGWRVWLRCPNCDWRGSTVPTQSEIDAFDDVLEEGSDALQGELKDCEREAIKDALEPFLIGLERDLITPDDFR